MHALVPLYPLYALLFVHAGLSPGGISALFAVWSLTSVLAEVPTGALADRWSRRGVLVLASVLEAACFGLWTALPSAAAFAAGFVLWGIGGSLSSGAAEALVFEGLAATGAESTYARLTGRIRAAELAVQVPTALAATALFAVGGYALVGWVSVGMCLTTALVAARLPDPGRAARPENGESLLATLRDGVAEVVRRPGLVAVVVAVALLLSVDGAEEYFPLMAAGWGVSAGAIPPAILVIPLAGAVGAALGGRSARLADRAVVVLFLLGVGSLGMAALWAQPLAIAAVAVFYGLYRAVLVIAEAQLQHRIAGPHRATVTSVAGLGSELATLLLYGAWTVGSTGALAVFAVAVVPVLASGLRAPSRAGTRRRRRRRPPGARP